MKPDNWQIRCKEHFLGEVAIELKTKLKLYSDEKEIMKLRENVRKYLEKECDSDTIDSMNKYFEFMKTKTDSDEVNQRELLREFNKENTGD